MPSKVTKMMYLLSYNHLKRILYFHLAPPPPLNESAGWFIHGMGKLYSCVAQQLAVIKLFFEIINVGFNLLANFNIFTHVKVLI